MKEKLLNNVRKRVMVWVALASMATLLPAQTYRLSGCVQDEEPPTGRGGECAAEAGKRQYLYYRYADRHTRLFFL